MHVLHCPGRHASEHRGALPNDLDADMVCQLRRLVRFGPINVWFRCATMADDQGSRHAKPPPSPSLCCQNPRFKLKVPCISHWLCALKPDEFCVGLVVGV